MTAIDERHVQWATVDRMRQMLSSTRRDFEITQTYTLFAGILCWVMQRVRWDTDDTPLRGPMAELKKKLKNEAFEAFINDRPLVTLKVVPEGNKVLDAPRFNDFSELRTAASGLSSLDFLVALRNAAAHGDHRRVIPINEGNLLRGYRFECEKQTKDRKVVWAASVCLDRTGMAHIAERLADQFCDAALPDGSDTSDAARIRESRR